MARFIGESDGFAPVSQVLIVVAELDKGAQPDVSPGWEQSLPATLSAGWSCSVDKVRYSVNPSSTIRTAGGGGTDGSSREETMYTWDILLRLEAPAVVHICRPYTRAGEVALLAAKVLGKRIVLSDFELRTSTIGASLGMVELADCLICDSEEAKSFPDHRRVEVVDMSQAAPLERLSDIYRELAATGEHPE